MADYAIGDIQGCYDPLRRLLDKINFDPSVDRLYAAGDIVNRGPDSLATLRFCHQLGDRFGMVLGNHDLHLLAIAHGVRKPTAKDTLDEVLNAHDRDTLLHWLQQQPLIRQLGRHTMVHAGIPPQWSIEKALELGDEVAEVLSSDRAQEYFDAMYGDQPDCWDDNLCGPQRWRVITNYFTRMRFCSGAGHLQLTSKGSADTPPSGTAPWYTHRQRQHSIVFGHWAALEGKYIGQHLHPLDTGCVWGGTLRAMCLTSDRYYEL